MEIIVFVLITFVVPIILWIAINKISFLKRWKNMIASYFWLKKVLRDPKKHIERPYEFLERIVRFTPHYKKTNWFKREIRKMTAELIRAVRKDNPHHIIGWGKAQKMYDDYFKMDNHIPSFEYLVELHTSMQQLDPPIYLTKFRRQCPVRGEKLFSYYINQHGYDNRDNTKLVATPLMKLVTDKYGTRFYFSQDSNGGSLNDTEITMYRFSTPKEIRRYHNHRYLRAKLEIKIEKKREELDALRKQQREI